MGKDAIRDIHEDAKQNSGKGDSEVRGAEFAVAVVAGLGAGVLGKKGSEADADTTRVESVVTKSGLKPGSMSNETVRKWYHKNLDNVASQIDSSLPLKEQALQAFKLRNQIKLEARELMSDRAAAEALPAPKTLQDVVRKAYQQGHTGDDVWRYMLGSSARSNKNVDAVLGLSR